MDYNVPLIDKNNDNNFFYNLEIGDIFKFDIKEYLWEDVYSIAISQGKKIKQIGKNNFLYNVVESCGGIVIRDIKKAAENIRDEEILRLQGELSNCYKRIDTLETQIGIRSVERLNRCDICKKHIYPYQLWVNTDTGMAHIECNLNEVIEELQKSNNKKDETIRKWSKDAQRIGSENQSLRIDRDNFKSLVSDLQSEINTLTEINEMYKRSETEKNIIIKNIENENTENKNIIKELNNINSLYEQTLREVLCLIIRVMKLLGDNSNNEFKPIPVVHLNGEQRIELKGWCKPLFDDLFVCLNNIKEIL